MVNFSQKQTVKTENRLDKPGSFLPAIRNGIIGGFGNGIRHNVIPGLWNFIENNIVTKPLCDVFYRSTTNLVRIVPISDINKNFGITLAGSLAPVAVGLSIIAGIYGFFSEREDIKERREFAREIFGPELYVRDDRSTLTKIYDATCSAVKVFGQTIASTVGATIGIALIGGSVAPIVGSIATCAVVYKAGSWACRTIEDKLANTLKSI